MKKKKKSNEDLNGLDLLNMSEEEYLAYKDRQFKKLGVEDQGYATDEECEEIYNDIMSAIDEALESIDDAPLDDLDQEWSEAWNRAETPIERYEVDCKYRALREQREKEANK